MTLKHGINPQGALWLGFFALILAAWAGLFAMILSSPLADIPSGLWAALCTSAAAASLPALSSRGRVPLGERACL